MATSCRAKPVKYVIMAGCDCCGQVHIIRFSNKADFMNAYCTVEHLPIYSSFSAREKVWREVNKDLKKGCLNSVAA